MEPSYYLFTATCQCGNVHAYEWGHLTLFNGFALLGLGGKESPPLHDTKPEVWTFANLDDLAIGNLRRSGETWSGEYTIFETFEAMARHAMANTVEDCPALNQPDAAALINWGDDEPATFLGAGFTDLSNADG